MFGSFEFDDVCFGLEKDNAGIAPTAETRGMLGFGATLRFSTHLINNM
jgi:hypothetical protein